MSVYCDGVRCHALCLRHGIPVWQHIGQSTTATYRHRHDMTSDVKVSLKSHRPFCVCFFSAYASPLFISYIDLGWPLTWKSGNSGESQGGGGICDEKVREIYEKVSKSAKVMKKHVDISRFICKFLSKYRSAQCYILRLRWQIGVREKHC